MNDACPACYPGDAPASPPLSLERLDGTRLTSHRCGLCQTFWTTRWDRAGWPISRTQATGWPDERKHAA